MQPANKITAMNIECLSGWHAFSQTWREASTSKKVLLVGGTVLALGAVAAGVAVALTFGVPPYSILEGIHYAYEAVMLSKHLVDYASKIWQGLSAWFKPKAEVAASKMEQPCQAVLPFMQALENKAKSMPSQVAVAA